MEVRLLAHTPDFETICARAARLCYSKGGIEHVARSMDDSECRSLIKTITDVGHLSCVEHASMTFGVEGVSRALSHQLVRHRLASYSQQSQRYVNLHPEFPCTIPDSIVSNKHMLDAYNGIMASISTLYADMKKQGIPTEDARYILPNATHTNLVVTMNARELLHFFSKRCCTRAQWEIRDLASRMLAKAKTVAPTIFEKAGAPCVRGKCGEGRFSCKIDK